MSIESEDTVVTHLTQDSNRTGPWGLTLENDRKNQRPPNKKKTFVSYSLLFTSLIIVGCLMSYLISEVNHLKEHVKDFQDLSTEMTQLKTHFESAKDNEKREALSALSQVDTKVSKLTSMANDINVKNAQLKVLVTMQGNRLGSMEGKIDRIKEQINMNILRNDHLERALETTMANKDMSYARNFVNSIDNERHEEKSNSTLHKLKTYVAEFMNRSQIVYRDTILTFENLTYDKIEELQMEVIGIKREMGEISGIFDGWKTSEDEGKLYLDLKKTVDRLKLSVTRK